MSSTILYIQNFHFIYCHTVSLGCKLHEGSATLVPFIRCCIPVASNNARPVVGTQQVFVE